MSEWDVFARFHIVEHPVRIHNMHDKKTRRQDHLSQTGTEKKIMRMGVLEHITSQDNPVSIDAEVSQDTSRCLKTPRRPKTWYQTFRLKLDAEVCK